MKITTPGMRATDEQPFQGSGYWNDLPQGSSFLATLGYFDDAFGIGIESKHPLHSCQSVVFPDRSVMPKALLPKPRVASPRQRDCYPGNTHYSLEP